MNFSCPTCSQPIQCPDDFAGKKSHCPKCGQKILVPTPPRLIPSPTNKTTLGKLTDEETKASSPAPSWPTAEHDRPNSTKNLSTDKSVPPTVMVAASLLLLYGGLILFCSCSNLAVSFTSGNQNAGRIHERNVIKVTIFWAILKCIVSFGMIASGLGVFRLRPAARWAAFSCLLADLLFMVVATILIFFIVNLVPVEAGVAQGVLTIALIVQSIPYAVWLLFCVPIGVLLNSPSARSAFAGR